MAAFVHVSPSLQLHLTPSSGQPLLSRLCASRLCYDPRYSSSKASDEEPTSRPIKSSSEPISETISACLPRQGSGKKNDVHTNIVESKRNIRTTELIVLTLMDFGGGAGGVGRGF